MCRILYALNQSHIKPKLTDFLSHSRHAVIGRDAALDGYGLASFSSFHKWTVYKTCDPPPLDDPIKMAKLMDTFGESSFIIGHIRNVGLPNIPPSLIENTHPFYYKNTVFIHNGFFDGTHLPKMRKWFYANILQELHPHIKGETDTELFFYFLVSIIKRREWIYGDIDMMKSRGCGSPTRFEEYRDAVVECFQLVREAFHRYVANFVYADKEYSIVGRIAKNATLADKKRCTLYSHSTGKGLMFSTEPIANAASPTIVRWNTFYVVNHLTGKYYAFQL